MNRFIIPLREAFGENRSISGNKAVSLSRIIEMGLAVPDGICITRQVYDNFIQATGIDQKIILELGRKRFEDMRWEELWDASLRIRNMFVKAVMPHNIKRIILNEIKALFSNKPIAVRSSSLAEDSAGASFAGMHDSFVNIRNPEKIIECIKLVWASLWSDAALLYRNELSLDIKTSAMAVIIQEMILGEISGVAFCVDPNNSNQAVIESVYGLNKGLVDGDVEPDRFFIERKTGNIISVVAARHERRAQPIHNGVRIINTKMTDALSLKNSQIAKIYTVMQRLEELFGLPQDIEWTMKGNKLFVLQSRPITVEENGQKGWYMSLRRSLENLQQLADRIEKVILPQMEQEAAQIAAVNVRELSSDELAKEVQKRKQVYDKWHDVYWNECIPFAHGIRLFGSVYNDTIHPEDPYEFIEIISPQNLKSIQRNRQMEKVSNYIRIHPQSIDAKGNIHDDYLQKEIDNITKELSSVTVNDGTLEQYKYRIINILQEMSKAKKVSKGKKKSEQRAKMDAFIAAFSDGDKDYARQLISIATKSYQLRDDDNIYLGMVQANLTIALQESKRRLGKRCKNYNACWNPEEVIIALKFPNYMPKKKDNDQIKQEKKIINARQLRGQPASKGIARGKARVIRSSNDLFTVKKNEIVVCDAIDPTMTFIIPLTSAIVERRGGMLIHGAIIAREYGIPCVTGIPQATEFIQTGDYLTVDGYYGLVINHSRTVEGSK